MSPAWTAEIRDGWPSTALLIPVPVPTPMILFPRSVLAAQSRSAEIGPAGAENSRHVLAHVHGDRIRAGVWRPVGKGTLACWEVGGPVGGGAVTPWAAVIGWRPGIGPRTAGGRSPARVTRAVVPGGPVGDVTGGQASAESCGGDVGTVSLGDESGP
ncbi:hypothetical protein GCM10010253_38720 [Streptomyces badius]|uniref:Uncharacterized protein n=1 Tax=Streptomyces badius TaxID=1941 RepID=A0ABQ2TA60_STRBA|nr:hypothetical protein GCM10010253_38720 [Streptomyces badius]